MTEANLAKGGRNGQFLEEFFSSFLPGDPEARLRPEKETRDLGRGGEISEGRRRATLSQTQPSAESSAVNLHDWPGSEPQACFPQARIQMLERDRGHSTTTPHPHKKTF